MDPPQQQMRFNSNYDIAYELGVLDTLSLVYARACDSDDIKSSINSNIPTSLLQAIDLRHSAHSNSTVPKDIITKAATLSQRAIEETANTSGSLADFIVTQYMESKYSWFPSTITNMLGHAMDGTEVASYSTLTEAVAAARTYMRDRVQPVCQYISLRGKKIIRSSAHKHKDRWSAECDNNRNNIHVDTSVTIHSVGYVVVCHKTQSPVAATATYMTVINAIDKLKETSPAALEYIGYLGVESIVYFAVSMRPQMKAAFAKMILN